MTLAAPFGMFGVLIRHWPLVWALVNRQIKARYRGSYLGGLWTVIQPLIMLGIYTFVFSVVFSARWDTILQDKVNFALFLFAGLSAYQLFAECVGRAPGLVVENRNYVKKVVFPLEILPWVSLLSALFGTGINFALLLFLYAIMFGTPPLTALLLPLAVLPLVLFILGTCWFFSALGVFFRDLRQLTGVIVLMFMFLSPIFYPIEAVPEGYRELIGLNPLASIIGNIRQILFFGTVPGAFAWLAQLTGTWLLACLGFAFFLRLKKTFGDVV